MGLPVVAIDDRAVLQIQPHSQRAQLGFAWLDLARAGPADGPIRPHAHEPEHRTCWLYLAICGERAVPGAPALRHGHGAAAAPRTESIGRWTHVSGHIALRILD